MALSCQTNGCDRIAVARHFWPGRDPLRVCLEHLAQARGVAQTMGLHLAVESLPVDIGSLVDEVTTKAVDEGALVATGWEAFRMILVPADASEAQIEDLRFAFYAGAQHLFRSMMSYLDANRDPTEDDLRRMQNLDEELRAWEVHAKKRAGL